MKPWPSRVAAAIASRPLVLFVTLYVALAALVLAVRPLLPEALRRAVGELTAGRGLGIAAPDRLRQAATAPAADLWAIAVVAMAAAGALALPVAWLYTVTRKKRGYQQSSVHALILLPVVVAGVVVLVKFSLALAFSLAGIVAAVRFRHTLEDSKDAIYIFAVTGIGLAAGVELSVAVTVSLVFNLVTVLLFTSDFGRLPADLEGQMAEKRMQRALSVANRTSQFVARLDREILGQMAPAQLEALAERAWARRQGTAEDDIAVEHAPSRAVGVLRVTTNGTPQAREAVEVVLGQLAKSWRFRSAQAADDGEALEYVVRLRKSVQPALLLDAVKRGEAGVRSAAMA